MPLIVISILFQVALVVHIVKTGRNTMWVWIVVMLPLAGTLAYLVVEILPELAGGRTARKLKRELESIVNPHKDINAAVRSYSISDTVENSIKLAEECLRKGMFEEARELYRKSLSGVHSDDPDIMHGLARAEFQLGNHRESKALLDDLIEKNPKYKNADAHLLYARAAQALGDLDLALHEYEILDRYYPGAEATYRYAVLLKARGEQEKAQTLLAKILHNASLSGKHYNALNKEWISLARSEKVR